MTVSSILCGTRVARSRGGFESRPIRSSSSERGCAVLARRPPALVASLCGARSERSAYFVDGADRQIWAGEGEVGVPTGAHLRARLHVHRRTVDAISACRVVTPTAVTVWSMNPPKRRVVITMVSSKPMRLQVALQRDVSPGKRRCAWRCRCSAGAAQLRRHR